MGRDLIIRYREPAEIAVIVLMACSVIGLSSWLGTEWSGPLSWFLVAGAGLKTVYYFAENLWHLLQATAKDLAYHRFLLLMAYNMTEVTLSFAVDFYCLQVIDPESFSGIPTTMHGWELAFECFYFSVLNFSFFGYGDITPSHIPAKIVLLLEVITAFTTVIFLLSDFVSMKESMRPRTAVRPSGEGRGNVGEKSHEET